MRCCCRYFTTSVKYVWIGLTLERDLNISIQCRQNVEELLFIWNWVSCLKYPAYIVFHCSRGKGWGVARKYLERMCVDISWREARWRRRRRRDQRLKLDQRKFAAAALKSEVLTPPSLVTVIWTNPPINRTVQNIQSWIVSWCWKLVIFHRLISISSRRENIVQKENY